MATRKRVKAAVSLLLLSEIVKLRAKEAKAVELLEKITGRDIVDAELAACIDSCYPNTSRINQDQAKDLLAKVERGEFGAGRARRMRGNGEKRA